MDQTFMKKKPVFGLLLSMSLPMVISMTVNSLYNIVDSYFVAQISEDAMTALSLVYPMQNLINAVAVGFGIGVNAVIAYYLGAQNQEKANAAASQGMLWNIIHGILLTIGCIAVMPAFLRMFTESEAVVSLGLRYSRIVFAFSIVITMGITYEKIFQSVGRMAASMASMMAGCITNIILDPIMIFGLGPCPAMGIEGAALATGIGQVVTLILYIAIHLVHPLPVQISRKSLLWQKSLIGKLYAVGIPATLNMALASVLISSLNAILAAYSQIYVVVLGVYYKLQTFLYLPANGVVQGMRPLIGYNYGAGEHKRVRQIYSITLAMVLAIMAAGTLLCLILPGQLIGLFSDNPETIQAGVAALRIICAGFIISSLSVTSSGALEGLGMGLPSLMISLCRYVVIIIPAAFLLSRTAGPSGVWHAFWITEAAAAVISTLIYRRATKGIPGRSQDGKQPTAGK